MIRKYNAPDTRNEKYDKYADRNNSLLSRFFDLFEKDHNPKDMKNVFDDTYGLLMDLEAEEDFDGKEYLESVVWKNINGMENKDD